MRKQIKWPPHLCILDTDIMMEKSDRVVHRSQNIKGREKNTGTNSKKNVCNEIMYLKIETALYKIQMYTKFLQ